MANELNGNKAPGTGDPRYRALLDQLWDLHCRKSADYGDGERKGGDFLANLRASESFGIPAWLGALVRLNDKVFRLQTFAKKGTLANEGVEDSLLDLAAYSLLALILFRETKVAPTLKSAPLSDATAPPASLIPAHVPPPVPGQPNPWSAGRP